MLVCRTGKLRMHYICITDSVLQVLRAVFTTGYWFYIPFWGWFIMQDAL